MNHRSPAQKRHQSYSWLRRTAMGAEAQLRRFAHDQMFSADTRDKMRDIAKQLSELASILRNEEVVK